MAGPMAAVALRRPLGLDAAKVARVHLGHPPRPSIVRRFLSSCPARHVRTRIAVRGPAWPHFHDAELLAKSSYDVGRIPLLVGRHHARPPTPVAPRRLVAASELRSEAFGHRRGGSTTSGPSHDAPRRRGPVAAPSTHPPRQALFRLLDRHLSSTARLSAHLGD